MLPENKKNKKSGNSAVGRPMSSRGPSGAKRNGDLERVGRDSARYVMEAGRGAIKRS